MGDKSGSATDIAGYHQAMDIQPHVLNRLIAARYLRDISGPELSAVSNPLAVAQKILVAHDMAELVFLGLSAQSNIKVLDRNRNPIKDPPFMALAVEIIKSAYGDNDKSGHTTGLLDEMNRLRVAFKHFGTLPDVSSSWQIFQEVVTILDDLCNLLVGTSLIGIDHTAAISSDPVKGRFADARSAIGKSLFKEALESISLGLKVAFWELDVPSNMTPGEASSEHALLLSGRGIDPASFLTMQKLLPITYNGEDVEWQLRRTGHEQNWNRENAEFCLSTAISLVVRLESALVMPVAHDFYDFYEDVVELTVDNPSIYKLDELLGSDEAAKLIGSFKKGDKFTGRATGHFYIPTDYSESYEVEIENAQFIQLSRPQNVFLPEQTLSGMLGFGFRAIFFKKEEVTISYQLNQWRRVLQEQGEWEYPSDPE